jgi:hypothetical protein
MSLAQRSGDLIDVEGVEVLCLGLDHAINLSRKQESELVPSTSPYTLCAVCHAHPCHIVS